MTIDRRHIRKGDIKCQTKKIKIDFETKEVMEDQRKTICIKGQEIPTWQFVWERMHRIELNMKRIIISTIVGSLTSLIIILVLAVIATRL